MAEPQLDDARALRIGAIFGHEMAANLKPVALAREGVSVSGYSGLPTLNRPTTEYIHFFVNDRPVRDRLLLGALKGAYHDTLPSGRQPVAVLFIDLPPHEIDVNVHPAKTEVRFRDLGLVKGVMISGVRQMLGAHTITANTTLSAATLQQFMPAFTGTNSAAALAEPAGYALMPFAAPGMRTAPAAPAEPVPAEKKYPLGGAVAQVHATYIVAQTGDGIVIVDQHAAHERLTMDG